MSQQGIRRMAAVFEELQKAAVGLIEMGGRSDMTGKQAQQDVLFGKLCQQMNDNAKERFMEIIKFAPQEKGKI